MIDIYIMQHNYLAEYLVIADRDVLYVFKYENIEFDQPLMSFKQKHFFIGKSKVFAMTEHSDALNKREFNGNTHLLECEDNEYVYNSGLKTF